MKNVFPIRSTAHIEEEAALWVARMDGGELTEIQQKHLADWLAADRRHVAAFERLTTTLSELDCLNLLAEVEAHPLHQPRRYRRPLSHWQWPEWTLAAMLFGCVLLGGVLLSVRPGSFPWIEAADIVETVYQTRTGEQSNVLLSDGSKLTLNTRSEVRVRIDSRVRAVYLNTGELYAEVAPNPRLPFVVYASNGSVRAVGTAFNVRIVNQAVEVTVREGTVAVSTDGNRTARPDIATLHAGTSTRYTQRIERPRQLSEQQLDRQTAWKNGKWAFDGQTLEEVLDDIGRYTKQRLVIADPQIAKLRIGGYFNVGSIEPFLAALETTFGITHKWITDDLIILSSAEYPSDDTSG